MNETKTPLTAEQRAAKKASRQGADKKGPANKEGRAHKLRMREIKVERQAIAKTIQDAKARKAELDAELKTLRPAAPPKAT